MSIPTWFDYEAYFQNKLATMAGYNELTLMKAFADAQYPYTAEGMYQHYVDHGQREGIAPNDLFNAEQYLYAKAAEWLNIAVDVVTPQHLKSLELQLEGANLTPLQHFQNHWSEYYATEGKFLNPSDNFNVQKYMEDKLAQMKAEDPAYTMQDLVNDFTAAGLDPITHYYNHGQEEGLTITPASASGKTIFLENDEAFGTIGNDSITAKLDTLNDYSYIDGGAGYDTLMAYFSGNTQAIRPEIYNVEKIVFSIKTEADPSGGNTHQTWGVNVDAGKIQGMTYLRNDDSRDSLAVEDVQTDSNLMTISWKDADPGRGVDFGVFFDNQRLKADDQNVSGSLTVNLMDVQNAVEGRPLETQPYDGFIFKFTAADGSFDGYITLDFAADAPAGSFNGPTATYETLKAAFNAALQAALLRAGLAADTITADLGDTFVGRANTGGGGDWTATGTQIVLSSDSGVVYASNEDLNTGWTSSRPIPPTSGFVTDVNPTDSVDCPLIKTNIHLDNVGSVQWHDEYNSCLPDNEIYGSESGDMVVGGSGTRGGVERFDITVDRGSWLSSLSSTNNTLRMITVVNGSQNNITADANDDTKGQLWIGQSIDNLDAVNMVDWQHRQWLLSTEQGSGLKDVKEFDGSAFEGQLNIAAELTAQSLDKYLKAVDGSWVIDGDLAKFAPKGDFSYQLGSGDDILNMKVNGGVAADNDVVLVMDGGAGDDLMQVSFSNITEKQVINSGKLQNIVLNGGDGDDRLWGVGNGAVVAIGGDGDDAIYVGQTTEDNNALWVFNLDNGILNSDDNKISFDETNGQPLGNDLLSTRDTVAYTGVGAVGNQLFVSVTFKGIESVKIAITDTNGTIATAVANGSLSTLDLNRAICKAIEDDPVLSKLLIGMDGAGHSLMIQSLIDGAMDLNDLEINLYGKPTSSNTYTEGSLNGDQYDQQFGLINDPVDLVATAEITVQGALDTTAGEITVDFDNTVMDTLANGDVISVTIGDTTHSATVTGLVAAGFAASLAAFMDAFIVAGFGSLYGGTWTVGTSYASATGTIILQENGGTDGAGAVDTPATGSLDASGSFAEAGDLLNGTDDGTYSINRVILDGGNDVIVLNAGSDEAEFDGEDYLINDTLVVTGAFNDDYVFNFDTGIDKIDFNSLFAEGTTLAGALGFDTLTGAATDTLEAKIAAKVTTAFNVVGKYAGYAHVEGNEYVFFQVDNDATAGVLASEVKILGTITLAEGTEFAGTAAGTADDIA